MRVPLTVAQRHSAMFGRAQGIAHVSFGGGGQKCLDRFQREQVRRIFSPRPLKRVGQQGPH